MCDAADCGGSRLADTVHVWCMWAGLWPRSRGLAPQNPHFRPKGAENPCKY